MCVVFFLFLFCSLFSFNGLKKYKQNRTRPKWHVHSQQARIYIVCLYMYAYKMGVKRYRLCGVEKFTQCKSCLNDDLTCNYYSRSVNSIKHEVHVQNVLRHAVIIYWPVLPITVYYSVCKMYHHFFYKAKSLKGVTSHDRTEQARANIRLKRCIKIIVLYVYI